MTSPAEKPDVITSAPPAAAAPLSTVAPEIAGEDSTLPPRVTLLMPSAVAAWPLPTGTSVLVPLEITMLPLGLSDAVTPAPPANWMAEMMLATVAVVPAPRPIVVLLPAVTTVVPPLNVIVLPLTVSTWPLSAVRGVEARCVPRALSSEVVVDATAAELFWSAAVPVAVVDEYGERILPVAAAPDVVAFAYGGGGVPTGSGLAAKSDGFSPPAASSVLVAAVVLATVFGWVGRLAAYWIDVVACAGMKLFWNFRTVATLPCGLPVFGSTVTPIK